MALDASSHWMIPSWGWAGFPDQETRLSACTSSTWQESTTSGAESEQASWTRPGLSSFSGTWIRRVATRPCRTICTPRSRSPSYCESQAWGLFLDSTTRVEFDLAHDDPQRAW